MDNESLLTNSESKVNSRRRPLIFFFLLAFIVLLMLLNGAILVHQYHRLTYCSLLEYNPAKSIRTVCSVTPHPRSCYAAVSSSITATATPDVAHDPFAAIFGPKAPEIVFVHSLLVALNELKNLSSLSQNITSNSNNVQAEPALFGCASALVDALSRLNRAESVVYFDLGFPILKESSVGDLKERIGGAFRDQQRCLEELPEAGSAVADVLRLKVQESKVYTTNSLAILSNIRELKRNLDACRDVDYGLCSGVCLEYLVLIWLFGLLLWIKDKPRR